MTDHRFKNGISIHIPDYISKAEAIRRWHDVVWQMSIILDPPTPEVPKVRKEYTHTEKGIKARMAQYSRWKKVRGQNRSLADKKRVALANKEKKK